MKKLTILIGLLFLVSSCGMFSKHGGGHCPAKKLEKMDTNSDGKISKDEFSAYKMGKFSKMDKDGDGFLSVDELKSGHYKKKCGSKCGSCGEKKCDGKTCSVKKACSCSTCDGKSCSTCKDCKDKGCKGGTCPIKRKKQ